MFIQLTSSAAVSHLYRMFVFIFEDVQAVRIKNVKFTGC
jgi:hypothetical protein